MPSLTRLSIYRQGGCPIDISSILEDSFFTLSEDEQREVMNTLRIKLLSERVSPDFLWKKTELRTQWVWLVKVGF